MDDSAANKPPRRPRYVGTHPRRFHEKYKELAPERYANDVAKVMASGKTPAGTHRSIMVDEVCAVLRPQPGQTVADCTLGYGGHAERLLAAIQPNGTLYALDADAIELPKTTARLRLLGYGPEQLVTRRNNYAGLQTWLAELGLAGVDMVLADLGVSSMQIDDPTRGFTFKADGPLDMRMNPDRGLPASEWLTRATAAQLAQVLTANADEPAAEYLAQVLSRRVALAPLTTTHALATAVRQAIPRATESVADATVRRVFQAIRIAVNDEFGSLEALLRQLPQCLNPGGRVAILTFHSGEDRRVKHAFKTGLENGIYTEITGDVLRPAREEQQANPRSASAKLRYAIRAQT